MKVVTFYFVYMYCSGILRFSGIVTVTNPGLDGICVIWHGYISPISVPGGMAITSNNLLGSLRLAIFLAGVVAEQVEE